MILLKNFFQDTYNRNVLFVFLMGAIVILLGSFATAFYFIVFAFLLFFHPTASIGEIIGRSKQVYMQLPILFVLIAFPFTVLITSVVTQNPIEGLAVVFSYLHFLTIVPMAIALYLMSKNANFLALFIRGVRCGLLLTLPLALFQIYYYSIRPEGMLGNALVFATIICMASGYSMLRSDEDKSVNNMLIFAAFAFGIASCFLTFARSMFILMGVISIVLFVYFARSKVRFKFGWKSLLAGISLFLLIGMFAAVNPYTKKLVSIRLVEPAIALLEGKIKDQSLSDRLSMQKAGWSSFVKTPILGVGIQNVMETARENQKIDTGERTIPSFTQLHNDYLTHAVGGGVVLLSSLFFILLAPLIVAMKIKNVKNAREVRYFAIILSIGYALTAIVSPVFRNDIMTTFYSISLVLILLSWLQEKEEIIEVHVPDFKAIATDVGETKIS